MMQSRASFCAILNAGFPFSHTPPMPLPSDFRSPLGTTVAMGRCLLAALACLGAWAAQAADVVFQPVAPHVYAFVGDTEGRTYENEALNANLGLVVTAEGALLIDSGASFQGARQIADAARRVTPQPIRWVINTGGQDHRWLGNGYFRAQGAEIMAHAGGQSDMRARGPEQLAANAPVLKEKMAGTEVVLPTRWLTEADTRLQLGGTDVQVVYRGGGHTPGDLMVWLPQAGVVFTGDVVYTDRILGLHPVSRTRAWLQSFEALEALKPRVVVPGHGRVTDLAQAQRDTGALLRALRAEMGKAVEEGIDLATAVRTFNAAPFQHLRHVEIWLPQLANRTYLEMEME
jgi:glyoxylase-like metal-dependent hydrolase (beta-lactamase superfamily II)